MAIKVDCPICSRTLNARDEMMGRRVRCPSCKNEFKIVMGHGGVPMGALSRAEARRRSQQAQKAAEAARRAGVAGPRGLGVAAPDPVTEAASQALAAEERRSRQRTAKRELARKVGGFDILPGRDLARWAVDMAALSVGFTLVLWAVWTLGRAGFDPQGVVLWILYAAVCVGLIFGINFFAGDSLLPAAILAILSAFPIVFLVLFPFALQEKVLDVWDWPLLVTAGLGLVLGVFGFFQRLVARGRFGPIWPALAAIVLSAAAPSVRYSTIVAEKIGLTLPGEIIPTTEVLHVGIRYKQTLRKVYQGLTAYAAGHSLKRFPPDLKRLVDKGLLKKKDVLDPYTKAMPGPTVFGGLKYVPGQSVDMARPQNILVYSDDKLEPGAEVKGQLIPGRERIYVLYLSGHTAALKREEFARQLKQTKDWIAGQGRIERTINESKK